ncbi:Rieske (2Fe-2S) protein [Paraburkholderia hospita]|uniref:Rieske (2Fe-2S) protein n=1 Tax=Paraburkholderia hospita TaxID=169430 RepID=UPI000DEFC2B6|nr:Rieske 2Fe-2S domain-containing protein [Paraburkholderia hospita]AXF05875.1 (2Fe-2S)-binding protein [Paraburkholderia hospita]
MDCVAISHWVRLCKLSALPPVGARGFDLRGRGVDDIFVVSQDGLLRAYRNSCPHWPGATLPWRKHGYLDHRMDYIVCHGHGARFSIEEGICILGPCLGQRLESIPLRIEDGSYVSAFCEFDRVGGDVGMDDAL